MSNAKSKLLATLVFIGVLVVDQATKLLAWQLNIAQINTGFSFNVLSSQNIFFYSLFYLAIITLLGVIVRAKWSVLQLWFVMIVAAGFSNLIDRFTKGGVVDFLPIPFFNISNNLADWVIVIGLVKIIWVFMNDKDLSRHTV